MGQVHGRPRPGGDRGVVLPAAALVVSLVAVAVAAVGYLLTATVDQQPAAHRSAPAPATQPVPTRIGPPQQPRKPQRPKTPKVDRSEVYVVVFNNSNVRGMAARTAARAQGLGWNVVATDNWYGTIVAPTVYYPARLHAAARVLARDLDITRVKPAVDPMQRDRLTVILTSGYAR